MIFTSIALVDASVHLIPQTKIELFIIAATACLPLLLYFFSRKAALRDTRIFIEGIRAFPMIWVILLGVEIGVFFRDAAGISNENPKYWLHAFSSASVFSLAVGLFSIKRRWAVAGFTGIVLSLLIFCDLVYHRYFGNVIPLSALFNTGQFWDVTHSIWSLIKIEDIGFLFLALGSLSLWLCGPSLQANLKTENTGLPNRQWRLLLFLAVATLYTAWNVSLWMRTPASWEIFDPKYTLRSVGPINAHMRDVAGTLREQIQLESMSLSEIDQIKDFLSVQAARKSRMQGPYSGAAQGSNVIFLQMEAVQKWVIGARINGEEVTPFLNRLANQSFYFSEIFDQTGESSTANCEYAALNSLLPLRKGATAFRRPNNDFWTLAHVLKNRGYSTYSAHAYKRSFWNRAVIFPRYGFDKMAFIDETGAEPQIGWGLADDVFLIRQAEALEKLPRPFFALLITLSSHHPYDYIPAELRRLNIGALEDTELGNYLHSVNFVDQAAEKFFQELESKALLQDTILVLYGDHDAKLQLNDEVVHKAAASLSLDKNQLIQISQSRFRTDQIPLIIKLPGDISPLEIKTPGGQVDIAPTVLDLLGLEAPESFLGQALFPGQNGFVTNLNGYASNNEFLYDPGQKENSCLRWSDFKPVLSKRCDALRARTHTTLDISRKITLKNLARVVTEQK